MRNILVISLGAVLGANLRYLVAQYVARFAPSTFPFATLLINISASFLLGFVMIWTTERVLADPRLRVFIAVGFCATFSTYSSYAYETFALVEQGQLRLAGLNLLLTNVACLFAVALGAALARAPLESANGAPRS